MSEQPASASPSAARELLSRALHLGALWALAVGYPVLKKAADADFVLMARDAAPFDLVLIGAVILFVPPLVGAAAVGLASLAGRRLGLAVQLVLVALLLFLLAMQILHSVGFSGHVVLLALGGALGIAGAAAYARTEFMRATLSVLSPAPLVLWLVFLFATPANELVFPGGPDAEASPPASDAPVVLLILDELPTESLLDAEGEIDASRYPGFAELARTSTWYPNATTVADGTERAVPAILTGNRPDQQSGPATAADTDGSIFTLLGDTHRMNVDETLTQVCGADLCERRLREPFSERVPGLFSDLVRLTPTATLPVPVYDKLRHWGLDIAPHPHELADHPPEELFENFLAGLEPGQPSLNVLHAANLVHEPWEGLPNGATYSEPRTSERLKVGNSWPLSKSAIREDRRLHLLELGYTDGLLRRLIAGLKAKGIWDEAVVVVTADHGIAFQAGNQRRITDEDNIVTIAPVPLFIKEPGQRRGKVDEARIRAIDITPTIAELVGTEVNWELDGAPASALPPLTEIEIDNVRGDTVTIPFDRLQRARRESLDELAVNYDLGTGWRGLIRSVPLAEQLGRRVPRQMSKGSEFLVEVAEATDASGGRVEGGPIVIDGPLGDWPRDDVLALVAGRRIVGLTRPFKVRGQLLRFQTVVLAPGIENPEGQIGAVRIDVSDGFRLVPLDIR